MPTFRHGPTTNLGKTLRLVGWTPLPEGEIIHRHGFQFNWVRCSLSFLKYWFRVMWTTHVTSKASTRADFDIESIDEHLAIKVIAQLPPEQKQLMITHFTGAACTGNMYAKFNPNVSPKCDICGVI